MEEVCCVFSVCVTAAPSQVTDMGLPTAIQNTSLMGDAFVCCSASFHIRTQETELIKSDNIPVKVFMRHLLRKSVELDLTI